MKEIKFRAWDKKKRKILEVVTLCFMKMTGQVAHLETWDSMNVDGLHDTNFPDEIILMQYTGLKDKNGKEIYEGDILDGDAYTEKGVVKFGNHETSTDYYADGAYGWYINREDGTENTYSAIYWGESKIIGNIYENPELLKDK